tara:strand:+ start:9507 stop:10472 length:966 start_codon:yes stop_codon:yes gene_type:complete
MTEYFNCLLNNIKESLGTIVYIGAGSSGLVDSVCAAKPKNFIAIEACGELCGPLKRKAKEFPFINVINEWVLPAGCTKRTAYFFNNPRYNSLCKPAALLEELPNLKLTSEEEVTGLDIGNFFSSLEREQDRLNLLLLSVQGAEHLLLQNLPTEQLNFFDYICIKAPQNDLYEKSHSIVFNSENFERIDNFITNNPSFLLFKSLPQISKLKNELKVAEQSVISLTEKTETLKSESNELLASVESLKTKLHQKSELTEELQNKVAALQKEREEFQKVKSRNELLLKRNNELEYRQQEIDRELQRVEDQMALLKSFIFNDTRSE